MLAEVDQLEQVADHPAPAGRRQPVAAREEVEVLPDLHVVVDPEGVRHEAEDATDLVGVPGDRPAGDLGASRPTGRSSVASIRSVVVLPAPFGPTRPKISPSLDAEVDAGHRDRPVVALDEALGPDDGAHSIVPVIGHVDLNPTPSVAVVDEPDQHAARRRVDVAARASDRVPRSPPARVRQATPGRRVDVEQLDFGHAVEEALPARSGPDGVAGRRDRWQRLDDGRVEARAGIAEVHADGQLGRGHPTGEPDRPVGDGGAAPAEADASIGSFVNICASDATTVERSRSAWNVVAPLIASPAGT